MALNLHPGQVALSCDTIGDLDKGLARHLIDAEFAKAVNDLEDRAKEDGKTRKVIIEVDISLVDGLILAYVSTQAKLPPKKTRYTAGQLRMAGKNQHAIIFMEDNPENPDQPTMYDEE